MLDIDDRASFIDESIMTPKGKAIEWPGKSPFANSADSGFTVEEIEYDEYLLALEEFRRINIHAEE